jgi:hypothetical protein
MTKSKYNKSKRDKLKRDKLKSDKLKVKSRKQNKMMQNKNKKKSRKNKMKIRGGAGAGAGGGGINQFKYIPSLYDTFEGRRVEFLSSKMSEMRELERKYLLLKEEIQELQKELIKLNNEEGRIFDFGGESPEVKRRLINTIEEKFKEIDKLIPKIEELKIKIDTIRSRMMLDEIMIDM